MADPPMLGIQGQWAESRTWTATFLPISESNHKLCGYQRLYYVKIAKKKSKICC